MLAPFRAGPVKPVFEKIATVPDFLTVSHAADASLAATPRRLAIRGTWRCSIIFRRIGAASIITVFVVRVRTCVDGTLVHRAW